MSRPADAALPRRRGTEGVLPGLDRGARAGPECHHRELPGLARYRPRGGEGCDAGPAPIREALAGRACRADGDHPKPMNDTDSAQPPGALLLALEGRAPWEFGATLAA